MLQTEGNVTHFDHMRAAMLPKHIRRVVMMLKAAQDCDADVRLQKRGASAGGLAAGLKETQECDIDVRLEERGHLRGGDGDGVAGVDAHGVHVLDGADDDHVVRQVAHHLQLILLPAQQRLLDQHLRPCEIPYASSAACHMAGFKELGQSWTRAQQPLLDQHLRPAQSSSCERIISTGRQPVARGHAACTQESGILTTGAGTQQPVTWPASRKIWAAL